MDLREKLTILVCSCDSYDDLWQPFFTLFNKYWENCPCRIILNTECKKFNYKNLNIDSFSFYNESNIKYGQRMIKHLNEITTPYTLILLDDFFIRKDVNVEKIKEIITWLDDDESITCFNFDNIEDKNNSVCCYSGFMQRPVYGAYKLNMQAGIWRTNKLKDYWENDDTPWSWEVYGNCRSFNDKDKFFCLNNLDNTPIYYAYDKNGMGVFRGKWCKDVPPLFEKENIVIDFSKRGFYNKNDYVNNVLGTTPLEIIKIAFHELPIKYFPIWFLVEIYNYICRKTKRMEKQIEYAQVINLFYR